MPGEAGYVSLAPVCSIAELTGNDDLAEFLVAREELVEGLQFAQRGGLKRFAHMFVNKELEPIPQRACLRRNAVKFAQNGAYTEGFQHVVGR